MPAILLLYLSLALLLCACERTPSPPAASNAVNFPPPPDVGEVSRFLVCRATPRRVLTDRERCELKALSQSCTPTNDCYVSCITSPAGSQIGGGCEHVCGIVRPGSRPDTSHCNTLPGNSGFKQQRLGPNKSFKPTLLRGSNCVHTLR